MNSLLQSPLEDHGLPVIDISQFPNRIEVDNLQYHPEVVKLGKACEEWGIFRIVNHGVPQDLLQKVLSVSQDLLSMPMELKDAVTTSDPSKSYTCKPGIPIPFESFCLVDMPNPDSILELSQNIWPHEEGNSNFCEAMRVFSLFLSDLPQKIIKLVVASLGLDVGTFYRSDFENCKALLRINGYSSHGKSDGEEALIAHAGRGCVTILHNDEEEGLQVRSTEGEWINIKPSPNSLIVNLGICLKAWSNGRYRCAVHRVIYKGWQNRLSVPLFLSCADDAQISAPEALVNEDINPFFSLNCKVDCGKSLRNFEEDGMFGWHIVPLPHH